MPPARGKVAEPEERGVVEGFAGGLTQRLVLVRYAGVVQLRLHAEHRFFRRLQNRVQAANDRHGQDDIAVFAPHVDIAQHVVCDAPYEAADIQGVHARCLHGVLMRDYVRQDSRALAKGCLSSSVSRIAEPRTSGVLAPYRERGRDRSKS